METIKPRRCVICGGLIVARGVPVWTQPVGEGEPPFPVRWEEAHMACSLVLSDMVDAGQVEVTRGTEGPDDD